MKEEERRRMKENEEEKENYNKIIKEEKESDNMNSNNELMKESSNIIVDIERNYKKSKKRLIIESDDKEFMCINNENSDYDEFIDLIRDIMNVKILINSEYKEWLEDKELRNELMKDSSIELLRKNIYKDSD